MTKQRALTTITRVATLTALTLGLAPGTSWSGSPGTVPFRGAELFIELNHTDSDLGLHAEFDGAPTKRLSIKGPPRDRPIFAVGTSGSLRRHGLSFLGFESTEPTFDELPPAEFFARFPEGEYEMAGKSLEGDDQESTIVLTHVMPAPAHYVHPPLAPCDAPVVVSAPVTIDWDAVTTHHPSVGTAGPVTVERYELAIDREDLQLSLFIELPPTLTEFPLPAYVTATPGIVRLEILVKAAGGNRTAEVSCFEIK